MDKNRIPAIRTVMMPKDTNHLGSIFGGVILSYVDLAAEQHARSIAPKKFVTKVLKEVEFLRPVYVGDNICLYASTKKVGKTSVVIEVEVEVFRGTDFKKSLLVTTAEVIMVAVDIDGKPVAIND